jgi:hypothetical protein
MTTRFRLGEFAYTAGAEQALKASGQLPSDFLERHLRGDWGNVSTLELALNEEGLKSGGQLKSIYRTLLGEVIWIITEADRSKTTLMLPEER